MTQPALEMLTISPPVPNVVRSPKERNRWGRGACWRRWGSTPAGNTADLRRRPAETILPAFWRKDAAGTNPPARGVDHCVRAAPGFAWRDHVGWYSRQAGLLPSQCVVQPGNKGTALAILHSLLSIAKLDGQGLVAILPCGHHYSDEPSFAFDLESAFQTAAQRPDVVVLLGAKPDDPEVGDGWIELGLPLRAKVAKSFKYGASRRSPTWTSHENCSSQAASGTPP